MYLFVDKKTQAVLHVANRSPGDERPPAQVFRDFNPETMEMGIAPEHFIPAHFAIRDGVVVDLEPPPAQAVAEPETLAKARVRVRDALTGQALAQRAALVPDYQLLNAGIGLYDEARVATLRATVQAFRDEVTRMEGEIAKARSVKALDALQASFPTVLVTPPAPAPRPNIRSS